MPVKTQTKQSIIQYRYTEQEIVEKLVAMLGLSTAQTTTTSFVAKLTPGVGVELTWTYTENAPESWNVDTSGYPFTKPAPPAPTTQPPPGPLDGDGAAPDMIEAEPKYSKGKFRINPKNEDV